MFPALASNLIQRLREKRAAKAAAGDDDADAAGKGAKRRRDGAEMDGDDDVECPSCEEAMEKKLGRSHNAAPKFVCVNDACTIAAFKEPMKASELEPFRQMAAARAATTGDSTGKQSAAGKPSAAGSGNPGKPADLIVIRDGPMPSAALLAIPANLLKAKTALDYDKACQTTFKGLVARKVIFAPTDAKDALNAGKPGAGDVHAAYVAVASGMPNLGRVLGYMPKAADKLMTDPLLASAGRILDLRRAHDSEVGLDLEQLAELANRHNYVLISEISGPCASDPALIHAIEHRLSSGAVRYMRLTCNTPLNAAIVASSATGIAVVQSCLSIDAQSPLANAGSAAEGKAVLSPVMEDALKRAALGRESATIGSEFDISADGYGSAWAALLRSGGDVSHDSVLDMLAYTVERVLKSGKMPPGKVKAGRVYQLLLALAMTRGIVVIGPSTEADWTAMQPSEREFFDALVLAAVDPSHLSNPLEGVDLQHREAALTAIKGVRALASLTSSGVSVSSKGNLTSSSSSCSSSAAVASSPSGPAPPAVALPKGLVKQLRNDMLRQLKAMNPADVKEIIGLHEADTGAPAEDDDDDDEEAEGSSSSSSAQADANYKKWRNRNRHQRQRANKAASTQQGNQ